MSDDPARQALQRVMTPDPERICPKCHHLDPGEGCPGNFPADECPNESRSKT